MNYLEILRNVIKNGQPKQAVRFDSNGKPIPVENGTIGTFCEIFRHSMSEEFPLSTLRRLPFKSTCVELEGFIKGITSKKWYQDRGCNFWDHWCCPQKLKEICQEKYNKNPSELDYSIIKDIQKEEDFLGECIYGASWRNFHDPEAYTYDSPFGDGEKVYTGRSIDQLKYIVDCLKTNPYDRRMLCFAWNPLGKNHTALPSCHIGFQVVVYGNKLNLTFFQRSVDLILNQTITTYGILLLLLSKESGLEPGELVGIFNDCHVYSNLLPKAKELAEREENELPTVEILSKPDGSFSIFDWEYTDIKLDNYNHQGKMSMGEVTV